MTGSVSVPGVSTGVGSNPVIENKVISSGLTLGSIEVLVRAEFSHLEGHDHSIVPGYHPHRNQPQYRFGSGYRPLPGQDQFLGYAHQNQGNQSHGNQGNQGNQGTVNGNQGTVNSFPWYTSTVLPKPIRPYLNTQYLNTQYDSTSYHHQSLQPVPSGVPSGSHHGPASVVGVVGALSGPGLITVANFTKNTSSLAPVSNPGEHQLWLNSSARLGNQTVSANSVLTNY